MTSSGWEAWGWVFVALAFCSAIGGAGEARVHLVEALIAAAVVCFVVGQL